MPNHFADQNQRKRVLNPEMTTINKLSSKTKVVIADARFQALWKMGRRDQAIRVYRGIGRLFWHAEAVGRHYERRGQMGRAVVEYEYLVSEYNKMRKDFLPLPKGPRELFVLGRWYADKDQVKARQYLATYLSAEKVWARDPAFRLRHKTATKTILKKLK